MSTILPSIENKISNKLTKPILVKLINILASEFKYKQIRRKKQNIWPFDVGMTITTNIHNCTIVGQSIGESKIISFIGIRYSFKNEPYNIQIPLSKYNEIIEQISGNRSTNLFNSYI